MPQLIITAKAADGLERCRLFLAEKNPSASMRASEVIQKSSNLLKSQPKIGRPTETKPLRELIIPFGSSGYIALCLYEEKAR